MGELALELCHPRWEGGRGGGGESWEFVFLLKLSICMFVTWKNQAAKTDVSQNDINYNLENQSLECYSYEY